MGAQNCQPGSKLPTTRPRPLPLHEYGTESRRSFAAVLIWPVSTGPSNFCGGRSMAEIPSSTVLLTKRTRAAAAAPAGSAAGAPAADEASGDDLLRQFHDYTHQDAVDALAAFNGGGFTQIELSDGNPKP